MAISVPASIGTPVAAGAAAGTIALTTNVVIPSAAKVWIVVTFYYGGDLLSSVGDGGSTVYTIDHQAAQQNNVVCIVQADYPSGLGSGATITATFAGTTAADRQIAGFYSTGVQADLAAAYGAKGAGGNTITLWDSGATTVLSGDILIGASKWEDSTPAGSTATGGNSELADWNAGGGFASTATYQIGTGASIHAQGTWDQISGGASGVYAASVAYTKTTGIPDKAGSGIIGP